LTIINESRPSMVAHTSNPQLFRRQTSGGLQLGKSQWGTISINQPGMNTDPTQCKQYYEKQVMLSGGHIWEREVKEES
jgi:hypothetical protein